MDDSLIDIAMPSTLWCILGSGHVVDIMCCCLEVSLRGRIPYLDNQVFWRWLLPQWPMHFKSFHKATGAGVGVVGAQNTIAGIPTKAQGQVYK